MKKIILFFLGLFFAAVVDATPPDLVVAISIDQFRYEYVERFHPYFADGGFNRFLERGANFPNARYPYATTATGPGHATIGTGHPPSESGIVANQWFNRITGETESCVGDPRAALTAGHGDPASPLNLESDSLGDRMQERFRGAKVIGVAIKDRAAILMAGRKATAAYWFDETLLRFVSSSYYEWSPQVLAFNERVVPFIASHEEWTESKVIPAADFPRLVFDPPVLRKYKGSPKGLGPTFPHPISNSDAFLYTPFANDLVLDFARFVIDTEHLGTPDGIPDILYVGLSPTDYLGHEFGPDSRETADNVIHIDRSLERFLDGIDKDFGGRVVVVLTADHGVQDIPEIAKARGREAGRIDLANAGDDARTIGDLVPLRRELELRIARKLGLKVSPSSPLSDTIIGRIMHHAVYLNWGRIADAGLDAERVKRVVSDELFAIKGVGAAFTNTELMNQKKAISKTERAVRLSFRPDRSGDVMFVLRAGYIQDHSASGTNHGQPVENDQHVPLMFWGSHIVPGEYPQGASPMDIATTIGAIYDVKAGREGAMPLACIK